MRLLDRDGRRIQARGRRRPHRPPAHAAGRSQDRHERTAAGEERRNPLEDTGTVPAGSSGSGCPAKKSRQRRNWPGPYPRLDRSAARRPGGKAALKVKLSNTLLGETCYVGTEADPLALTLTTATTNPPPPNKPISGKTGTLEFGAAGNIIHVGGTTVVDNEFRPRSQRLRPRRARGPGRQTSAGLPSAAGNNSVVQETEFSQAYSEKIKHQFALPAIGRCVKVAKETGKYETWAASRASAAKASTTGWKAREPMPSSRAQAPRAPSKEWAARKSCARNQREQANTPAANR